MFVEHRIFLISRGSYCVQFEKRDSASLQSVVFGGTGDVRSEELVRGWFECGAKEDVVVGLDALHVVIDEEGIAGFVFGSMIVVEDGSEQTVFPEQQADVEDRGDGSMLASVLGTKDDDLPDSIDSGECKTGRFILEYCCNREDG